MYAAERQTNAIEFTTMSIVCFVRIFVHDAVSNAVFVSSIYCSQNSVIAKDFKLTKNIFTLGHQIVSFAISLAIPPNTVNEKSTVKICFQDQNKFLEI